MTSSVNLELDDALVPVDVRVDDTMIHVRFKSGREIASPVDEFPRLRDAVPEKRVRWELNGRGYGIHWPDVDEDITVRGLIERDRLHLADVA